MIVTDKKILRQVSKEWVNDSIHAREEFRHNSFLSPVVDGIIIGFGLYSYRLALESLIKDE